MDGLSAEQSVRHDLIAAMLRSSYYDGSPDRLVEHAGMLLTFVMVGRPEPKASSPDKALAAGYGRPDGGAAHEFTSGPRTGLGAALPADTMLAVGPGGVGGSPGSSAMVRGIGGVLPADFPTSGLGRASILDDACLPVVPGSISGGTPGMPVIPQLPDAPPATSGTRGTD